MTRPKGLEGIKAMFGDPAQWLRKDGTLMPGWETRSLKSFDIPRPLPLSWDRARFVSRIRCHKLILEPLKLAFEAVEDAALWNELRDYGGCYAWRLQRWSGKLSTHCWGIAVDIDVARNPMGAETPRVHPGIVQSFEAHGFFWGFRFPRQDPMHFQFCEGY